jgi:metal-sulfur cluster biosynthetic enzyme
MSVTASQGAVDALRDRVVGALGDVYDPELDEPITRLRFVSSVSVSPDGDVDVLLRLPTPQCAPNFAFLMGADARRAVRGVDGVQAVTVRFEDHYTGEEINLALRDGAGFSGAFPGETDDDDLEALRAIFTRKALIARQSLVCERLLAQRWPSSPTVQRRAARCSCAHRSVCPSTPARPRSCSRAARRSHPTDSRAGCAARDWFASAWRPTAACAGTC